MKRKQFCENCEQLFEIKCGDESRRKKKTRNLMECQTDGGGFEILQEPTRRAGISFLFFSNIF